MSTTPSQRKLFSLAGLAITTLVLTFLSAATLLVLRPARVGPTPGIGDMKLDDAVVVLREKAKVLDNPLCHLLVKKYRCDPARRVRDVEQHVETLKKYGDKVPEYVSSQTRKLVESTDESVGHILDDERGRVGLLLFGMIALGSAGALALWYGVRGKAFIVLGLGAASPFLLNVDEYTAAVFSAHLGVIAILSLFAPTYPQTSAARRYAANMRPRQPANAMPGPPQR